MKNELEQIKTDLLDLKLGDKQNGFNHLYDYIEKTTLRVIKRGDGIKIPSDGFAHCINLVEDDKKTFVEYADINTSFKIRIASFDIRQILILIANGTLFKGFSLEEIQNSDDVVPVYKIIAAK